MADMILKKHPLTRVLHYLFLLPFLPALRPLLVNYRLVDLLVYTVGVVLVVVLVIYGNHRPLVRIENDGIFLYLHYRHNAEYHPFGEISGYRRNSPGRLTIDSRNHKPVTLHLKRQDLETLVNTLKKENVDAQ